MSGISKERAPPGYAATASKWLWVVPVRFASREFSVGQQPNKSRSRRDYLCERFLSLLPPVKRNIRHCRETGAFRSVSEQNGITCIPFPYRALSQKQTEGGSPPLSVRSVWVFCVRENVCITRRKLAPNDWNPQLAGRWDLQSRPFPRGSLQALVLLCNTRRM